MGAGASIEKDFYTEEEIKVIVGDFRLNHILNSECVFVTGTAAEIQFVKSIEKTKFKKNNIFNELKNCYEKIKKNPPIKVSNIKKII